LKQGYTMMHGQKNIKKTYLSYCRRHFVI